MRNFVIAMGLLVSACGGDKIDQALSKFEGFKDSMCACTDKVCTDKTHEEYKKWENEMEKSFEGTDKDKIDKSKLEKFEVIEKEMKACRRKFRDAPKS